MPPLRRVAFLSLHTSPLEQPGSGDAGGMNVYVRSLAGALAARGTEVEIFTRATYPTQPLVEHPAPGVCVHNVQAGPRRKIPKEDLPDLVNAMVNEIDAIKLAQPHGHYDLIHAHYWLSGIAGLELSTRWDVPLVHTMHTMAKVKNQHLHSGEAAEPKLRELGEQRIVDAAARLIANTTAEASELQTHYNARPERIDVVSPGVDLDVFKPAFRAQSRAAVGIPSNDFHVVFAGRMQRLKGPHVLLAAAGLLRETRPGIPLRLSLIGAHSGARHYDLDVIAKRHNVLDAVTFVPPVPRQELADWFRAADLVAMPSFSESFGLVALEAQACGTPVIATRVGGLSNAVCDGRTGLLVDGHQPAAWAQAMEALYDDEQTRGDLGRAASLYAQSFGWQHSAASVEHSYSAALSQWRSFP
ncbi:D-inositol-3-phosphate glycosyltransferase [Pseudarthrobacter sp. J1738]|uniref:D-inositol-3-phosphate glycosyltransferase n=1 Tax=Pseudarthrobacter sp. J1738 TaxID=3420446 RepID=UPI003D2B7483